MDSSSRAAVYVDGFNLYCGLKEYREQNLYGSIWLDIEWLCKRVLRNWTSGEELLEYVKYFTTIPSHWPQKSVDHSTYVSALKSHCPHVIVENGQFIRSYENCKATCRERFQKWQEKESDVQLALSVINDAHMNKFDCVYIISADADHIPIVRTLRTQFPHLKIGFWFPPGRFRRIMYDAANRTGYELRATDIKRCQLPDPIILPSGSQLVKPNHWR